MISYLLWCAHTSYNNIIMVLVRQQGFHLATKIWDGSVINEWVYLENQVPWDMCVEEFL